MAKKVKLKKPIRKSAFFNSNMKTFLVRMQDLVEQIYEIEGKHPEFLVDQGYIQRKTEMLHFITLVISEGLLGVPFNMHIKPVKIRSAKDWANVHGFTELHTRGLRDYLDRKFDA